MLFDAPYYFGAPGRNYDVAPDGRFLMIQAEEGADGGEPSLEITVVLNCLYGAFSNDETRSRKLRIHRKRTVCAHWGRPYGVGT